VLRSGLFLSSPWHEDRGGWGSDAGAAVEPDPSIPPWTSIFTDPSVPCRLGPGITPETDTFRSVDVCVSGLLKTIKKKK